MRRPMMTSTIDSSTSVNPFRNEPPFWFRFCICSRNREVVKKFKRLAAPHSPFAAVDCPIATPALALAIVGFPRVLPVLSVSS